MGLDWPGGDPGDIEPAPPLQFDRCVRLRAVTEDASALPTHAESVRIDAPVARVWELVIAMDRYGEWSTENTGGYWRKRPDGETGTGQLGDQFVGINRLNGEEWKAAVEIIDREELRTFAFVTGGTELNLAQWRYELEPDGDATVLTERWTMSNPAWFRDRGGEAEVERRTANARASIPATLQGMKATAEIG